MTAQRTPRLDDATLLVSDTSGRWELRVRPNCGDATIFRPSGRPRPDQLLPGTVDEDRSQREAARRARVQVRRIVTEHRCTRLLTLTLAPEWATHDRSVMVGYIRDLQREIKRRHPDLVYVLVIEPHPGGHGLHVHGAISAYVAKQEWAEMWAKGHVDIRKFRPKGHKSAREIARRCGAYLAKYVTKDVDGEHRGRGEHRFFRPQGISIVVLEASGLFADMIECLRAQTQSGPLQWLWCSCTDEDWRGPPVVSVRW